MLRMRFASLLLTVLLILSPTPGVIEARQGGPGPGPPIWPRPGQTDDLLYEKAMRIQSRMWHHLSPEGLLIVRHRRGADQAMLSQDALYRSDAAMWTGCYAAAQVCRWYVTRDPDALAQVQHLAKGLKALSDVTGVPGSFARNVGRPLKPGAGEQIEVSPTGSGLWMRSDISRDQLAGVVLGWYMIGRYMEDTALKALAAEQSAAISRRLWEGKMWLRDFRGRKTKYGELRADVQYAPFIKNGSMAAIGFATAVAASDLNPGDAHLRNIVERLAHEGWERALPEQHTFLHALINSSNVYMVALPLLVLADSPRGGRQAHRAKKGMRALRRATVGWWNAGICACWLLGGLTDGRQSLRGEVRATLHALPDREEPRILVREYRSKSEIAPIWQREPSSWYWSNNVRWFHIWKPGGKLSEQVVWTGADWLFAYWLSRLGGELKPRVGPGAEPRAHHCLMDYPAWM